MPGASGGPHGHGVDRHGASAPRSSRSDAFSSRRETEGKAACSHATALTLWSSAGVVAEACWKSARKARDITKRPRRQTRRRIRACCTCVPKKNRRIEERKSRVRCKITYFNVIGRFYSVNVRFIPFCSFPSPMYQHYRVPLHCDLPNNRFRFFSASNAASIVASAIRD